MGRDFVFDFVDGLHYKCYKISFNRGGSYIESYNWINDKKVTTNPQNNCTKPWKYLKTSRKNSKNWTMHRQIQLERY